MSSRRMIGVVPLLAFFLLAAATGCVFAQEQQDTASFRFFSSDQFFGGQTSAGTERFDTLPPHRHVPYHWNLHATLGNIGLASQSIVFNPNHRLFRTGLSQHEPLLLSMDDALLAHVRKPYSRVHFVSGTAEEQLIDFYHTQNISPRWNASAQIGSRSSDGLYAHQRSEQFKLRGTVNYSTRSGRYRSWLGYFHDKINNEESGGLISDSTFEADGATSDLFFQTHSSTANSLLRRHHVQWSQQFFLSPIDSGQTSQSGLFVRHHSSWNQQSTTFKEPAPDSAYYSDFFSWNDSLTLDDSIAFNTWTNALSLGWQGQRWLGLISTKYAHRQIHQNNWDTVLNDLSVRLEGSLKWSQWRVSANLQRGLTGYLQDATGGELALERSTTSGNTWRLDLGRTERPASFFSTRYQGEAIRWNHQYDLETMNYALFSGQWSRWSLNWQLGGYGIQQLVYFDGGNGFQQATTDIQVIRAQLQKHVSAGPFHLDALVVFQQSSSDSILPLPSWSALCRLYFESKLFKQKLGLQLGVDGFYHSAYAGYTYVPWARQFSLQRDRTIGDYPIVDTYAQLRVGKVTAFFKLSHLSQGAFGRDYYTVVGYPIEPRKFRFGIQWEFWD